MLIIVDPQSGVPVYRQVMDQIKFHIATGLLAPGDELPSTRTLSSDLGVNPMTISKAYSFLEMEDIVDRRPGRPLVVKEVKQDVLDARRLEQLEESLQVGVTIARQLGIADEEAVRLFAGMLQNSESPGGTGPAKKKTKPDTAEDGK
ncbi:MAG TPA: GntR family transcriptional regulator [Candidatus Krumholzibacterium sp.]|nr:GntR family transcriptional regulator [Candidatus Krumholzibacterium sp.]